MKLCALICALAAVAPAAELTRITYTKEFKGAVPPYFLIEVNRDGSSVYKEAPNDEQPISFKISPDTTAELFASVAKVDNCARPLESNLKVAFMGLKTIHCEVGAKKTSVSFNYSLDTTAQGVADFFERIAETQQHIFNLERTVRFDKLGVNKILLQIEAAWDRQRLLGEDRLIPLLERVVRSQAYLNMARERAGKLIAVFQAPKPPPATAAQ